MARIGLDLTQRMIVNQWVSFLDELGVLKSIPRLNGVKEMPDFEQVKDVPLLGYVYVDHDAGISLKVEGLYQSAGVHDPEIETISKFIRDSVSLKFRFDIIRMIDFNILDDKERNRLSLPVSPDWLRFYESPELNVVRNNVLLDRCREFEFSTYVFAIIPSKRIPYDKVAGNTPEIVWVRLERYSDCKIYSGHSYSIAKPGFRVE